MKISIKWAETASMLLQGVAMIYGVASELAPAFFAEAEALFALPQGYGLVLAIISFAMFSHHFASIQERASREDILDKLDAALADVKSERKKQMEVAVRMASHVSLSVPFHERDFYALWSMQVKNAKNCIDVTHLGTYPPQGRKGPDERAYFDGMLKIYKESHANVRRVERYSPEKEEWIASLVRGFNDQSHCSLAIYKDPSTDEFPFAVSVSHGLLVRCFPSSTICASGSNPLPTLQIACR